MDKELAVGIDLGTFSCPVGIVNQKGEIAAQDVLPISPGLKQTKFLELLSAAIVRLAKPYKDNIGGVGLGIPSWDGHQQKIVNAPNLPQLEGVALTQELAKHLPPWLTEKIIADNDANVALDAERFFGNHQGAEEGIMFFGLGGGVGFAAYILDPTTGRLVKSLGRRMRAGEGGHIDNVAPATAPKRICGCGYEHCLEAHASATAVIGYAIWAIDNHLSGVASTSIANKVKEDDSYNSEASLQGQVTPLHVELAAKGGDRIALKILEWVARSLARGMRTQIQNYDPTVIVISGGLSKWTAMISRSIEHLRGLKGVVPTTEAIVTASKLKNAGVLGAAAQVLKEEQIWGNFFS